MTFWVQPTDLSGLPDHRHLLCDCLCLELPRPGSPRCVSSGPAFFCRSGTRWSQPMRSGRSSSEGSQCPGTHRDPCWPTLLSPGSYQQFMVRSNSEDQTPAKGHSSALHSRNSLTGGCRNRSLSRVSQSFTAPDKHQEFPSSK